MQVPVSDSNSPSVKIEDNDLQDIEDREDLKISSYGPFYLGGDYS